MIEFLRNAAFFVIALGILVTIHEYGHFWVARRNGVKVLTFSVGFGKTLYKWQDKQGTEFVIAMIPLGGYVKMLDERIDEVPQELKSQAFNNKTVLQRMAIIFAGPAANLILAVFVLMGTFLIGERALKPVVGSVIENSIAAQSGIPNNTLITSVNGRETIDWFSLQLALMPSIGEQSITIQTQSMSTGATKAYQLDIASHNLDRQNQSIITTLGFVPYRPNVTTQVAAVTKNSAAQRGGLQVGDEIIGIGDEKSINWFQMVEIIKNNANNPLSFQIMRQERELNLVITPDARENADGLMQGFVGVGPVSDPWPESHIVLIKYGFVDSFVRGLAKTWEFVEVSFVLIGKLITADMSVKNLSGPISIAQGAGNSADAGLVKFLGFLALISVNLGVINLLPLPILDGGHLFYYTIELIRGKSVSERAQEIGFKFGAIVLFLLMGIAIINDITRLS
jgi:regulator of sigma E protease